MVKNAMFCTRTVQGCTKIKLLNFHSVDVSRSRGQLSESDWIWDDTPHLSFMVMIEYFFFPNSRALLPTFCTYCPDESHFAQMGSHFAQNTTPNSCSLLSSHTPLSGICTYTKHLQTQPKTPLLLAWTWQWTKWTTVWAGQTGPPTGQNVWKVDKTFLEVGKKNLFMLFLRLFTNGNKASVTVATLSRLVVCVCGHGQRLSYDGIVHRRFICLMNLQSELLIHQANHNMVWYQFYQIDFMIVSNIPKKKLKYWNFNIMIRIFEFFISLSVYCPPPPPNSGTKRIYSRRVAVPVVGKPSISNDVIIILFVVGSTMTTHISHGLSRTLHKVLVPKLWTPVQSEPDGHQTFRHAGGSHY